MSSRLVNVRLDADRLRKARILREGGITLSVGGREAIDERYGALRRTSTGVDVTELVRSIFEEFPDPVTLPTRGYDVHDRKSARAAIRGALAAKKK